MAPSPNSTPPGSLPPLPDMKSRVAPEATPDSPLASILSGIMPVKQGVDKILEGCRMVAQSLPGSEQSCGQIVAIATGFLPQAAQQTMQPGAAPSSGMIGPVGQAPTPLT